MTTHDGVDDVADGAALSVPVRPHVVQEVQVDGVMGQYLGDHVEDAVHYVIVHTALGLQRHHVALDTRENEKRGEP